MYSNTFISSNCNCGCNKISYIVDFINLSDIGNLRDSYIYGGEESNHLRRILDDLEFYLKITVTEINFSTLQNPPLLRDIQDDQIYTNCTLNAPVKHECSIVFKSDNSILNSTEYIVIYIEFVVDIVLSVFV